jgi:spore cortex formation protein SpoVR/YcgB (stage V sporulation)
MKTTVIKAETVENASKIYGNDSVNKVFEMIQNDSPTNVYQKTEDQNLRACLLYLFSGSLP